jgi:hypothetical protein
VLQDTLEQQLKAMTDKQKEYPIFANRRLVLAKEKQREDILASQQISRTLQFDVNEGIFLGGNLRHPHLQASRFGSAKSL